MKFEALTESVPTLHMLKRIASAHVVDYGRLAADDLKANILRTQKQYTHPDAVQAALEQALWFDSDLNRRVLSELILIDSLINVSGHLMSVEELEDSVTQTEQTILNESNERDLKSLAGGRDDTEHYTNLSLYNFVLDTAWQHRDTKSVDEANLLRRIRERLGITAREHRTIEARLGKYPKPHNELHTRSEVQETVRALESLGLLFEVRDENHEDFVAIADEIAGIIRTVLNIEIRRYGYQQLLESKYVRKKSFLQDTLQKFNISFSASGTLAQLQERVLDTISPSNLLGGASPKDGLNNDILHRWCLDLGLTVGGKKAERIARIIEHFDQLEARPEEEQGDSRACWYQYYTELAGRDIPALRAQHVIEKDNEIERYFESATNYLFETRLNHTPLRQAGTEHPDGLLSFRDTYIMWDNKSKETPVNLKDHLKQFDSYMNKADKPVPIFLVIGPCFTPESEHLAIRYTAENIGRSVALIEAEELRRWRNCGEVTVTNAIRNRFRLDSWRGPGGSTSQPSSRH